MITIQGVELPDGNLANVEDSFKYLWIPQANGNYGAKVRKSATAKYLYGVRQLNSQNKIRAMNTYALPVIRYTASIITRPKGEIEVTEIS